MAVRGDEDAPGDRGTKLEQSRADFEETMARCRRVFGDVQPLGALIEDGHVVGAINLLRRTVTDYRSGEPISREPDETEAAIIESTGTR